MGKCGPLWIAFPAQVGFVFQDTETVDLDT